MCGSSDDPDGGRGDDGERVYAAGFVEGPAGHSPGPLPITNRPAERARGAMEPLASVDLKPDKSEASERFGATDSADRLFALSGDF